MSAVSFQLEPELTAEEFADVLVRSTLGQRRPVEDLARLDKMLRQADVIVTARHEGFLVGIARAITDFSYCCYLSDLAVDEAFQRQGIGRELLRLVRESAGPEAKLILLAAPKAAEYYPHIGMTRHESCWVSD